MALKFKKLNISGVEFLLGICSPQFIPSRDLTLTVIIPKLESNIALILNYSIAFYKYLLKVVPGKKHGKRTIYFILIKKQKRTIAHAKWQCFRN